MNTEQTSKNIFMYDCYTVRGKLFLRNLYKQVPLWAKIVRQNNNTFMSEETRNQYHDST